MLPVISTLPSNLSGRLRSNAAAIMLAGACVAGLLTIPGAKAGSIYVVVNGEQITKFDVEKRVGLLGDRAGGRIDSDAVSKEINERIRVEVGEWWKKFVQSPEINNKFREYVQEKGARTQAEVENGIYTDIAFRAFGKASEFHSVDCRKVDRIVRLRI